VFLPLAFVEGVAGQLFRDQALTVTYSLVISLIVAMTLIPMMVSLRGHNDKIMEPGTNRIGHWVQARYESLLDWSLRRRMLTLAVAAGLLVISIFMLNATGTELVPELAQGSFEVTVEAAPGTPLEATDRVQASLQQTAADNPAVELAYGVAGSGNRIDANPTESGENIARMLIAMKPGTEPGEQASLVEALRNQVRKFAGLEATFASPELLSFDKPLEIEVQGYDLADLRATSDDVLQRLRSSDRFADVESSMEQGHPEVQIYFDQERAAALGLTVKQISDQVVGKIRGKVATRYSWRDRKIDVLVRMSEEERQSIDAVRELIINPQSARPVPLSAVAEIRVAEGPAEIRRSGQERVALVTANLAYGDLGSSVKEAERLMAGLDMPNGQSMRITGQSAEMKASFNSLVFALCLAIFLVYLVMAAQFESLVHPFVILFSIPLASIGVALALWLTHTRLSVIVFIGLIMLAGIVVNNASHSPGGEIATAPHPDDYADYLVGPATDGTRVGGGLRDACADGNHGDRGPDHVNLADFARSAGHVYLAGSPSRRKCCATRVSACQRGFHCRWPARRPSTHAGLSDVSGTICNQSSGLHCGDFRVDDCHWFDFQPLVTAGIFSGGRCSLYPDRYSLYRIHTKGSGARNYPAGGRGDCHSKRDQALGIQFLRHGSAIRGRVQLGGRRSGKGGRGSRTCGGHPRPVAG
jgi:hypothetical protein